MHNQTDVSQMTEIAFAIAPGQHAQVDISMGTVIYYSIFFFITKQLLKQVAITRCTNYSLWTMTKTKGKK